MLISHYHIRFDSEVKVFASVANTTMMATDSRIEVNITTSTMYYPGNKT